MSTSAYALDGSVADGRGAGALGRVEPLLFLGEQHGRTQELRQRVTGRLGGRPHHRADRMRGAASLGLQPLQARWPRWSTMPQHQDRAALEPQLPQLAMALAQVAGLAAPAPRPPRPPHRHGLLPRLLPRSNPRP